MDQKLIDIFKETTDTIEELTVKFNKVQWNFITNATSENYNQLILILKELVNYYTYNQNIPMLIKESRKKKSDFSEVEKSIVNKMRDIKADNEREDDVTDKLVKTEKGLMRDIINTRVQYNSKDCTTNHLADLLQRRTSLQRIKILQKNYFYKPVKQFKKPVHKLISVRNEYARAKGYDNYYTFFTKGKGLNTRKVKRIINKADKSTLTEYKKIKKDLDSQLVKKFNSRSKITPSYIYGDPFFRYYPLHMDESVNVMFKGKDIAYAVKKFYSMLGINMDSIYEFSDLYIRPGKYQNPVIIDMDRNGDVRFSANSKSNFRGIYSLIRTVSCVFFTMNMSSRIPFILKELPPRGIVEAFTMFMTKYALTEGYIAKIIAQYDEEYEEILENITKYYNLNQYIHIRFHLAKAEFEMKLYKFPDADPDKLWEESVEKYQLIDPRSMLRSDSWIMLDSLIFDPFESIFELDGFNIEPEFEKIREKHNLKGEEMADFFIEELMQYGYKANMKYLKNLSK